MKKRVVVRFFVLSFICALLSFGNLFGAVKPEEMVAVHGLPQTGTVRMGWCKDTPEFFQVIVDTESPISGITIKPQTFKIVKDNWYIANGSRFIPYPIKATKDGEIDLNYTDSINCMVTICAYPGNDPSRYVWTNGSFEDVDETGFPRNCDRYVSPQDATGYTLTVTTETARTGKYSLKLRANDTGFNACGVRLNKPVSVEPGQEYLVQGWYKTIGAPYRAGLTFKVSLWSDNKNRSNIFDTYEYPLVDSGDKWNRAFVTFKVPEDLVNPRVKVLVLQIKHPVTMYWDDLAIMPKPHEAWQFERPQTQEQMTPDFTTDDVLKYWNSRDAWKLEMPTGGKPGIKVDGKPLPLYVFMSSFGMEGWPRSATHKDFFQQGFDLQFISIEAERKTKRFGGPIWKGDNDYDFTALEKRILALLEFNPKAKVGLYVSVWPYRKFGDVHPEAAWVNAKGQKVVGQKAEWRPATERKGDEPLAHSLSAEAFRKSAGDYLFAFGQFLKNSPVGKAVVGIHLCGGTDGQWFKPGWTNDFGEYDRCEGARGAFGNWLKGEYKNDLTAFRKAWGDEMLTFETVAVPPEKDRESEHYLLDPNIPIERRVIDANRFIYAGPAETINRLAESFKKGIGRPAWVTTYYHNQHMGYWFLLQKPWLDGTVSVPRYGGYRRAGNAGDIATIPDTLRLHNRFFIGELDYRTELGGTWGYDAHHFDKRLVIADREFESGAAIWRELGGELSRGGGAWHYSLMGNAWNDPRHMKYMGIGQRIAREAALSPVPDHRGQIAVFVDERASDYCSTKASFHAHTRMYGNYHPRFAFLQSGCSWDHYLLEDLENPNRPDYKVYVFLASTTLTESQVKYIEKNLQKDGRVIVFINNAGYYVPGGFDATIKRLTGLPVHFTNADCRDLQYLPVGNDRMNDEVIYCTQSYNGPRFYLLEKELGVNDRPLAKIVGTDWLGSAIHRDKNWTSVYIGGMGAISTRQVRNFVREAGMTPIGPEGDTLYCSNGILTIHAITGGVKTLRIPSPSKWIDAVTQKTVAENASEITVDMKLHETKIFFLR